MHLAEALAAEIRSSIYDFEPHTDAERVLYNEGLGLVRDLVDQRRLRLLEAGEGIPYILRGVLVVGGIIMVGFTYLFGLENTRSHTLMIAALAAVISLVLFTTYALDHAFGGITRVDSDAFELVLGTMERNVERRIQQNALASTHLSPTASSDGSLARKVSSALSSSSDSQRYMHASA